MSHPSLISIPDQATWDVVELALREHIGATHHASCTAARYPDHTPRAQAKLDEAYEMAIETYRVITGRDIISNRPVYDAIVAETKAKRATL